MSASAHREKVKNEREELDNVEFMNDRNRSNYLDFFSCRSMRKFVYSLQVQ